MFEFADEFVEHADEYWSRTVGRHRREVDDVGVQDAAVWTAHNTTACMQSQGVQFDTECGAVTVLICAVLAAVQCSYDLE